MRYLLMMLLVTGFTAHAKVDSSHPTYLLPNTCYELMPDASPYLGFLEAVALGGVSHDRNFSKRLLRILAMRSKLNEVSERARESNPIDKLVEKTLCFYREQKEPLRVVPYDDEKFTAYMKTSLRELELKVEDAVYQAEVERVQKKHYEIQLQKNREVVEELKIDAEVQADKSFERLSSSAKQKVKSP